MFNFASEKQKKRTAKNSFTLRSGANVELEQIDIMDIQDLKPRRGQIYTLKAIKYRLRFTDMTMQDISHDLNFPNPSFFGKYCKEHLGMTPLEYRIKYHKGT